MSFFGSYNWIDLATSVLSAVLAFFVGKGKRKK